MIRRAKIFLLVAAVVAAVVLATNLPLGALLHGRATVAAETRQLSTLEAENQALSSQVRALDEPTTVGQIAHEDYGLVRPGQRSTVVLPAPSASGSNGATGPLASSTIPVSDLLPSDSILAPATDAEAAGHAARTGPGFWGQVLQRLEFWKSVS